MVINVIVHRNLYPLTDFEEVPCLNGIILPFIDAIPKKQWIKSSIQFKESLKKLPSNFPIYLNKNLRLINVVFHRKITFLYILSKMKALRGIILPLRHFNSKKYGEKASMINVFYMKNSPPGNYNRDAFPFNIPFHPGEGPEIIYPDGPLEPEDPEEDPGDEPDDY